MKEFTYILEIARQGSITKAADRLYITQPALSRFLQRMEKELGASLFYKYGKSLLPTKAGECYLEYARKMVQQSMEMQEALESVIHNHQGVIRIGASASRGDFFASWVLPLFHRKYPNYKTKLSLNTKKTLLQMLDQNELDVIFVNTTVEYPNYICSKIASEDMVLLVNHEHFLVKEAVAQEGYNYPFVKVEEWKQCPFVYASPVMNTGQFMRGYFKHMNIHPPIVSEIENIGLIFLAVESKLGLSIVPSMPHMSVFHGKLHYLALEGEEQGIWDFSAIMRKENQQLDGLQKLLDVAKEVYETIR